MVSSGHNRPVAQSSGAGENAVRLHVADRLALRPREAAEALGISERKLRQLLPRLPHVRLDGVVLLPVEQLRRWLAENAQLQASRVDSAVSEIMNSLRED